MAVPRASLFFLSATLLLGSALAQSGCSTSIVLSSCAEFIVGNTTKTTSSMCCSQLTALVKSQPQCVCNVLAGFAAQFGFLNQTAKLVALPGVCNISITLLNQCSFVISGGSGAPTTPASPTSGGGVLPPATPPAAAAGAPSSGGAAPAPSPGRGLGSSSAVANGTPVKLPLIAFVLYLASYAF